MLLARLRLTLDNGGIGNRIIDATMMFSRLARFVRLERVGIVNHLGD